MENASRMISSKTESKTARMGVMSWPVSKICFCLLNKVEEISVSLGFAEKILVKFTQRRLGFTFLAVFFSGEQNTVILWWGL